MECDICSSHINGAPGLCCPACARTALYPLRVEYATALLSKISLGRKVEASVAIPKDHGEGQRKDMDDIEGTEKHEYERRITLIDEGRNRMDRIMRQRDILQARVDDCRQQLETRRTHIRDRRDQLQEARAGFEDSKEGRTEPFKKSIKKLSSRHDSLYKHTVSARVYLCKQVTLLAGLRRDSEMTTGGTKKYSYTIAGISIPDLRELNHVNPRELSSALTNIVHLLNNVCHYLSLRLPAEVVVPHKDWPLPSIYTITSSYLDLEASHDPTNDRHPDKDPDRKIYFPYNTPVSPPTSRSLDKHTSLPRPRPLFLDRKLVQLAREDPLLYSLFIEGIALFAWDIAWLCRVQGVSVASDNWEDICALGQNLWTLLMVAPSQSRAPNAVSRAPFRNDTSGTASSAQADPLGGSPTARSAFSQQPKQHESQTRSPAPPSFGMLSHGMAHTFLRSSLPTPSYASEEVSTLGWKFSSPTQFVDKLKTTLANDMSGLEWELLDGLEETGEMQDAGRQDKPNGGTSGWTKLKSRAVEM